MLGLSSWTIEYQQSFKNVKDLESFLGWNLPPNVHEKYPLFIPKRIAEKIKIQGPLGSFAQQFIPQTQELDFSTGFLDPIGDKNNHKAPQLIHRYLNRALFTPTNICPIHCRYCFRKNELNTQDDIFHADFTNTLNYLNDHPEISEIIFTGGDPLTLSNERLDRYLNAFESINSIKDIRFHTRFPVILPERIDSDFIKLLNKYSMKYRTLSISIHTNHVDELDTICSEAIKKLSRLPIQLLSQTVLLKGVNNNSKALFDLFNQLIELKIRPYYLHHPDQVMGGTHFYLPIEEGRRIFADLRRLLPGWAIPNYVIDIPGGAGKVGAFNPENYHYSGSLIGHLGELHLSPEPSLSRVQI